MRFDPDKRFVATAAITSTPPNCNCTICTIGENTVASCSIVWMHGRCYCIYDAGETTMNSMRAIIVFLFVMWVMILLAGVAVIYVIGSISVTGYGNIDGLATVALKGLGAIALIIAWIFVLGKVKQLVFKKQIFQ